MKEQTKQQDHVAPTATAAAATAPPMKADMAVTIPQRSDTFKARQDQTAADVAEFQQPPHEIIPNSIYDIRSSRRRNAILLIAAVATMLVPCTDTIYLPALEALGRDLHADRGLVATSVAIYMFLVGIGTLLWGPASDKFGRRSMYALSMVLFLGTSLGCLFAPTIGVLVAFRGLQGVAVSSFLVIGQGVLADIVPPHIRGTAQGMLNIPLLVGPIIGPLLGGVLSQNFGWRSTFICLVVFAGGIVMPLLLLLVPETLQYRVVKRMSRKDLSVLDTMAEASDILEARPKLTGPWQPLRYLLEGQIAPYAALGMMTFGGMFASLTEWPVFMSQAPYGLNEGMIGVSYLALGIAGFLSSPVGGLLSDVTAGKWSNVPSARLIPAVVAGVLLSTTGLLVYGWTLAYKTHIVGPLIAHVLIGAGSSATLPGVFGYISTIKQANASAASAGVSCGMFVLAGVLILVSAYAVQAMGVGPFFTLLAGLQLLVSAVAGACAARGFVAARQQQEGAEQLPVASSRPADATA